MEFPSIDMKATGKRIKQLRQINHLKVEDVSSYMGFESPQAVYKWQRGDSLPTVDNLYALSKLFNTPMDNIIQEREKAGEKSPALIHNVWITICSYNLYEMLHYTQQFP